MNRLATQLASLLLMVAVTGLGAEESVDPAVAGAATEPTLVKRTTDAVVDGVQAVRRTVVDTTHQAVERGGQWVDKGKQGAGKAWSKTRQTTADLADKTAQGVGGGVEYVRDGTGRLMDKTVEVSGAAWQGTKHYSATAVNKGRAVARVIKEEVVGTDEAPAEVIDKSSPAHP